MGIPDNGLYLHRVRKKSLQFHVYNVDKFRQFHNF